MPYLVDYVGHIFEISPSTYVVQNLNDRWRCKSKKNVRCHDRLSIPSRLTGFPINYELKIKLRIEFIVIYE